MDMKVTDAELVRWARHCTEEDGCCVSCAECPFGAKTPGDDICVSVFMGYLADRVETLSNRCAWYAEEIAVLQERLREVAP